MSDEMMNTKEVARYLGINGKQVYALIGRSVYRHEGDGEMGISPEAYRRMDRVERKVRP